MNNFEKSLEEATDEELMRWINNYDPRFMQPVSEELTRRVLKNLQKTIRIFNEKASEQTQKMIRLTQWITGLTIAMFVGLIVQIILAIAK